MPKGSQQHREEAAIPAHIAAEVVPALEAELTQREEELVQLTYDHAELKERYSKLRDIYGELTEKHGELKEKHVKVKQNAETNVEQIAVCNDNLLSIHGMFSDLITKYREPYAQENGLNIKDWDAAGVEKVVKRTVRYANEASTLQD